jgi:hypothetical protein
LPPARLRERIPARETALRQQFFSLYER